MDQKPELKTLEYKCLYDMAQTDGWKIVEQVLQGDVLFATNLIIGTPTSVSVSDDNGIKRKVLDFPIKDFSSYRYAHGMCAEARKVLEKVKNACKKYVDGSN